jgi:hypothetical protein
MDVKSAFAKAGFPLYNFSAHAHYAFSRNTCSLNPVQGEIEGSLDPLLQGNRRFPLVWV